MRKVVTLFIISLTISLLVGCNNNEEESTTKNKSITDYKAPTFNPLPFITRSGIVVIPNESGELVIDREVFGITDNATSVEDLKVEIIGMKDAKTGEKYDLTYNESDPSKTILLTLKATDEVGNSKRQQFGVGISSKEDLKELLDDLTIPFTFTEERLDYFKTEYDVEGINETTLKSEALFEKLMKHLYRLSDDVYTRYEVLSISDVTKSSTDTMDVYEYSVNIRDHYWSVSVEDRNDTDYIEYTYNMKVEVPK